MKKFNIRVIAQKDNTIIVGAWEVQVPTAQVAMDKAAKYSKIFFIEEQADEILNIRVNLEEE